jgi:hypothetical protein
MIIPSAPIYIKPCTPNIEAFAANVGPAIEPNCAPKTINGYPFFADSGEVEQATNDQN